ncbi:nicotinamidase/pyrazinamidase [compost metagenome]
MGLATDYCVKYTVLDALKLGYRVNVITDGCRGVNLNAQDSALAFMEMSTAGATLYTLADWQETQA